MSSTASSADGQSAPKYNMLSWRRFHLDCQILSSLIEERIPRADVKGLISIARGGLAPGVLLAQFLDVRYNETLCVKSYHGTNERSDVELVKGIAQEVLDCQGEGFVVVDDLSDSGETLRFARSLVPKAVFCTVYSKPKGASAPDFFAREIPQDEWIVFPWETVLDEEDAEKVTMLP